MKIFQKIKNVVFWPKKELNWWIENWKTSPNFRKRFIAVVLGFGLAGILWGLEIFKWTVGSDDAFVNPFSYILGVLFFGLIAGPFLIGFKNKKKILKIITWGTLGWIVAFLFPAIFIDWMLFLGSFIWPVILFFIYLANIDLSSLWFLNPSVVIGQLWVEFLSTGLIIGLFYALILKLNRKSMAYRTAIGFALAALISPVVGNLIGNYLLNSLLSAYIITFALIGVIFGLSLFSGMRRSGEMEND